MHVTALIPLAESIGDRLPLAGLVNHLKGSALAYLVGIHQLPRRDQPETVVDQALQSHEPGELARRELDQAPQPPPF